MKKLLIIFTILLFTGCSMIQISPEQKALEGVAKQAGFIYGCQHPEMIAQAKLIAMGINASQDEEKQKNFNLAVQALLKYYPEPILKSQINLLLVGMKTTSADITPIVLSFIQGMENSQ